jgi:lysozyme
MTHTTRLEKMLSDHEGFRSKPYQCTAGKWTIGYGRNIEDNPLSVAETVYMLRHGVNRGSAMWLLRGDIKKCTNAILARFDVAKLNGPRLDAITDMAYNLGIERLAGFKRMWAAIEREDWHRAADEMLSSKWAAQVGKRARTLAAIMRTGGYDML